jgi:hypothetical protein
VLRSFAKRGLVEPVRGDFVLDRVRGRSRRTKGSRGRLTSGSMRAEAEGDFGGSGGHGSRRLVVVEVVVIGEEEVKSRISSDVVG